MCVMGRVPQLMSVWRQPWVSAGICFVCYRCDGLRWVTWGRRTGVQGDGRPLGVRACCCLGWDCLGRLSSCCILLSVFRSRVVIMEWTFRACLPFGHVSMFWRCLLEVRREQSTLGGCDGKDCELKSLPPNGKCFSSRTNCVRGLMALRCVGLSLTETSQGQCFGRRWGQG